MDKTQPTFTPNTLKDLLAMSHIFNGIGSAAGAAIGAIVTCWFHQVPINLSSLLTAALSTLLISNGGFIVNDIIDLEIDRINRPDRPLAAGRIPVRWAWALYAASTVIGVVLGFIAAPSAGIAGLIIATALYLYSAALKKRFVVGHIAIGVMGGMLLPFGGLAMGYWLPTLYTVPITFLAFFAREVVKTVPDVDGDRAQGVDNFATSYGPQVALRLGQVILTVCLVLLPGLALVWTLNVGFLLITFVIIWPLFFAVLWIMARDDPPRRVQYILRLSKLFFLLVAVALLVGSLR